MKDHITHRISYSGNNLDITTTYVQRAMLKFIAERGGRILYRFGVESRDEASGTSPAEKEILRDQKRYADVHIRKMGGTDYALITITRLEIRGPNGETDELILTDIGRNLAEKIIASAQ